MKVARCKWRRAGDACQYRNLFLILLWWTEPKLENLQQENKRWNNKNMDWSFKTCLSFLLLSLPVDTSHHFLFRNLHGNTAMTQRGAADLSCHHRVPSRLIFYLRWHSLVDSLIDGADRKRCRVRAPSLSSLISSRRRDNTRAPHICVTRRAERSGWLTAAGEGRFIHIKQDKLLHFNCCYSSWKLSTVSFILSWFKDIFLTILTSFQWFSSLEVKKQDRRTERRLMNPSRSSCSWVPQKEKLHHNIKHLN